MTVQEYPIPRFQFQVTWDGLVMSFSEVTGLVMERQKIEYRSGDSPVLAPLAIPGLLKNNNVTCKNGTFAGRKANTAWFNDVVAVDRIRRKSVIITLLNESRQPVAAWTALRCFPVKFTASDLKSDANETAIETLEIAHEGLSQTM